MDFFADGGFQQLFCDLNEQLEQDYNLYSHQTLNEKSSAFWSKQESNTPTSSCYANYLDCGSPQLMDLDLNEKQLQHNLNYLLSGNNNSLDIHDNNDLISISSLKQDLADWEYKFLDNYIEIPELVDFLPEKTPLCNDNCNHFLQESAENLKLFPSTPNSPSSPSSTSSSSMSAMQMEKSYPCTFGDCCKIYAKPAHLKAHLRRHMGEKPYICNWPNCSWRFSRSDELARHRRSHSGVKPYKCDFCGKCFARSDHLTKHRKVHERRLLAASKAGKTLANGELPASVLTVRPGRKRKNQFQ